MPGTGDSVRSRYSAPYLNIPETLSMGLLKQSCPHRPIFHIADTTMLPHFLKALWWPHWFQDKVQTHLLVPKAVWWGAHWHWSLTQELILVGTPFFPQSSLLFLLYWIIPISYKQAVLLHLKNIPSFDLSFLFLIHFSVFLDGNNILL